MSRWTVLSARSVCLLTVILLASFATPHAASAQPVLGLTKTVSNVTTGSAPGGTATAGPGQVLQYALTYSVTGTTASTPLTITDVLDGRQTFNPGTCSSTPTGATCANSGGTMTFAVPTLPGPTSGTVYFQVTVNAGAAGTIYNSATASAPGAASVVSTPPTAVQIYGTGVGPGACFSYSCTGPTPPCTSYYASCGGSCYNPYFYSQCYPACNNPAFYSCYGNCFSQYYYSSCSGNYAQAPVLANNVICGVISGYRAPDGGAGYLTVNGITLVLVQGVAVTGTFTVGQSYCVSFTLDQYGRIVTMTVGVNVPNTNYVCGTMSQFSPGYYPWAGNVYSGYTPYAGYNPYVTAGSYGPYPASGAYSGYYGYSGPMVVGGYPYPVAAGTYFPFNPTYGNPYCFVMNNQGNITGSLSVVPTAAFAVESASGVRGAHGQYKF